VNASALLIATFLACLVEAVEATTIVLAAGTARNWRSAIEGTLLALLVLAAAVGIAGPAIMLLPIGVLRIVVGGLLLVFGLQWIRKAVLRAGGRKALHDEAAIFEREVAGARAAGAQVQSGRDPYAFTLAFKGVLLEGLEVVFITLTFGTNAQNIPLAAIAAAAAVVVVVLLGIAVRGPLSRVPENTLKFIVGIMLTGFGIFWSAEGAGAVWPGADLSLLAIIPGVAVVSLATVAILRRRSTRPSTTGGRISSGAGLAAEQTLDAEGHQGVAVGVMTATADGDEFTPAVAAVRKRSLGTLLVSFGAFWVDFLLGDDWIVPVIVALGIAATAGAAAQGASIAWLAAVVAVLVAYIVSVRRALR
jgi:uncharacterized membrane protein